MTTITGTILSSADVPAHVLITFAPLSAPSVGATGKIITPVTVSIKSIPADGTFSVALESGNYSVTYATLPSFVFYITVPASGGPYTIDQVVTATPGVLNYAPTGSGSPQGVVTGVPGQSYVDTTNGTLYYKMSGTGNTGWQAFVQL
jgi:hypothetical protein